MNDLIEDGLLDVQQAAAFYSVGRSTIYGLMDAGLLPLLGASALPASCFGGLGLGAG